ncbi:MAG: NRDE family protein [Burkholderiales bacterium]
MCLAVLALERHPRFPLVLAANRDEFFDRPAAPLDWWRTEPNGTELLSGRDLQAGGTWLGLTRQGRLGLLTNIRAPQRMRADAPSRGTIVTTWLDGAEPPEVFWQRTVEGGYNGFNLIAADFANARCHWLSSDHVQPALLGPGLYGLSNAALDEPWPKVRRIKSSAAQALCETATLDSLRTDLFQALRHSAAADDAELPNTGLTLAMERTLSAVFIHSDDGRYGTRCSTLVISERGDDAQLRTHVFERSFDREGGVTADRHVLLPAWPTAR